MKKKLVMTIGAMVVAAVIGLGFSQSGVIQAEPDLSPEDIREKLADQYPGTVTELELNKKSDGVYEVEIEIEEMEYELIIDGNTGEVMDLDENATVISEKGDTDEKDSAELMIKEKNKQADEADSTGEKTDGKDSKQENKSDDSHDKPERKKKESNNQTAKSSDTKENGDNQQAAAKKAVIDSNEAANIALAQFSGEIDEVELDKDDGRLIYEIEIENGNKEAEIEVDAYTGEVVDVDIDD